MSGPIKRSSLRGRRPVDSAALSRRLAQNMRRLRREQGLTLQAAAESAQLQIHSWQELEAGVGKPTLATLCRVAEALGVDPAALVAAPPRRKRNGSS